MLPAEDAAMLYCYSDNLAETGVISYFRGGPRAEGATDFLWMLLLAGAHKLGAPTPVAAVLLGVLALSVAVEAIVRRSARPRFARAVVLAAVLPSPYFVAHLVGFSTLLFGSAIAVALLGALERRSWLLYGAGCIACLVRPDGVVFVGGLALAHLIDVSQHARVSWRVELFRAIGALGVPLAAYWAWRWGYFSQFFPLPFVVKSNVSDGIAFVFSRSSLVANARVLAVTAAFLLAAARAEGRPGARWWAGAVSLLVIVPVVAFYSRMDLQHNIGDRFQFPVFLLGVVLCAWFCTSTRWALSALAIAAVVLLPNTWRQASEHVARYRVELSTLVPLGLALRPLHGVRLLTSEAGLLPYLSRVDAYDSWGLNTPQFSEHFIQPEDVIALRPDMIYMNADIRVFERMTGHERPYAARGTFENHSFNVFLGARRDGRYHAYQIPLVRGPRPLRMDAVLLREDSPYYEDIRRVILGLPGTRDCDVTACTYPE